MPNSIQVQADNAEDDESQRAYFEHGDRLFEPQYPNGGDKRCSYG